MTFCPDPTKIRNLHTLWFDEEPTERQGALYDAYPDARGYSDVAKDPELFRAVLHLALVQAIPPDGDQQNLPKPYVFYPKTHDDWVLEQIRVNAEAIFTRLRAEKRVKAAKFLGDCFQALLLGHLVFQMSGEPPCWVAVGFKREDALPQWLAGRLHGQ